MAYRLGFADLSDSVRACAHGELRDAIDRLEHGRAADPVTAVHEARKDIKKTRALLRLVRDALPGKVYKQENRALRDAARHISAARDADVLVATMDALARRCVGHVPETSIDALRAALAADVVAARAAPDTGVAPALEALRAADERVDEWVPEKLKRSVLVEGAALAYRNGRAWAREIAGGGASPDDLHEWRKAVKDLWYHTRLVAPARPGVLEAEAVELKALSELLGDDHDHHVLAERAAADHPEVAEIAEVRRSELQAEARALGRRVYALPPKAFAARLDALLRAAQDEARAAAALT